MQKLLFKQPSNQQEVKSFSHRINAYNSNDQTSTTTSGACTATCNTPTNKNANSSQPPAPIDDQGDQVSGLNTSGDNSTIYECVKLLDNDEEEVLVFEDTSTFNELLAEGCYLDELARRKSSDINMLRQDDYNQLFDFKHLQTRRSKPEVSKAFGEFNKIIKGQEFKKKTELKLRKDKAVKETNQSIPFLTLKTIHLKGYSNQSSARTSAQPINNINTNKSSTFARMSATADKFYTEQSRLKSQEGSTLISKLITLPSNEKERRNNSARPSSTKNSNAPTISFKVRTEKSEKLKTEEVQFVSDNYQAIMGQRKSYSKIVNPENSKKNQQFTLGPTPTSISRNVHAIVTPRTGPQNQLTPVIEVNVKKNDNKINLKTDNKAKRHTKMTSKIGVIEVDLTVKGGMKQKEDKINTCTKQIEDIYDLMKRTLTDKKEYIMKNDVALNAIENLRNCMFDTQNILKGL